MKMWPDENVVLVKYNGPMYDIFFVGPKNKTLLDLEF